MEIEQALAVIRRLADGLHPDTADPFERDSPYQLPQVIRALHRAVLALEFQQEKEHTRRALPANAGKPWSDEEDTRLLDELRHGISLQSIAISHSRRVGSIVARLVHLRKTYSSVPRVNA